MQALKTKILALARPERLRIDCLQRRGGKDHAAEIDGQYGQNSSI
jgi:hypothetical protein